jgi:hypothetical protein
MTERSLLVAQEDATAGTATASVETAGLRREEVRRVMKETAKALNASV